MIRRAIPLVLFLVLSLAACGTDDAPPRVGVDSGLPACASLGCDPPSSPGSSCGPVDKTICTCPHPDGASPPLACQKTAP